jgi:quinol---cytochrome c reductase iron-sulfur subunit, bacillus type
MSTEVSRRSFYITAINLLGALMSAAAAIPAAAYLLIPPKSKRNGNWVEVADLNQLEVGEPKEIVYNRKRTDGWKKIVEKATTWLVRTDRGNVIAFTPSCTHLGCAYHWDDPTKRFICPCHGSVFALDGKVLVGPAPRPLDRYQCRVQNGQILIDSQIIQGGSKSGPTQG